MYYKLPIFANRLYTKTSDFQDLYELYAGILEGRDPTTIQESLFTNMKVIYDDLVINGFGSDWDCNFNKLLFLVEDIPELSHHTEDLMLIKKYSRGYSIDNSEIMEISDRLEELFRSILEYMDSNYPWTKLNNQITTEEYL